LIQPVTLTGWLLKSGFWLPLLICTWLALAPFPPEIPVFRLSDVLQHGFAFTYLSFALSVAYPKRSAAQAALLMLLYGIGIELVQSLEIERDAELKDVGVDVIGISLGLLLARLAAEPVRSRIAGLVSACLRR
jgi:VanZ family protein